MPLSKSAAALAVAALSATLAAPAARANDGNQRNHVETRLKSYQEVPAVSSAAGGRFKASIDNASNSIHYELSFSGLEGDVRQSHIHFGQHGVNGGIMMWLCQSAANPSPVASTPVCPQSGTVNGTLTASDVVGPSGQGVAATEFAEAVRAIRSGIAYVNVHSSKFPGGEIRGQLRHDD
jgi:hypothetical protein